MAEYRVSVHPSGHNFLPAVTRAGLGDVVVISPGEYDVGTPSLANVRIVGRGGPGSVVLHGRLVIAGDCRLDNITIRAPHFENSVTIRGPGARLELNSCAVVGEQTAKYPAIFNSGGILVMRDTVVHHDLAARGVQVEGGGELHAIGSGLAWLTVNGAHAVLQDSHLFALECVERARVESSGALNLYPEPPQRALTVQSESSCSVERLFVSGRAAEALCEDAFLRIGEVGLRGSETLVVHRSGNALVETDSSSVMIDDPAQVSREPTVIVLRPENGRTFGTEILPKLQRGDAIILEEGQYRFDGLPILGIAIDVMGKGRADRTVINGSLEVMAEARISLSNITVRAHDSSNAIVMKGGGACAMTNVIIENAEPELPALYVSDGTVTMDNCFVVASADMTVGSIDIDQGAHLDATDSDLGWLRIWNASSATLTRCTSQRVWVRNSTVTSQGGHVIKANDCRQRHLIVDEFGEAHFDQVTTDVLMFEAMAASGRLKIGRMEVRELGSAVIFRDNGADVQVAGDGVELRDAGDTDATRRVTAPAPAKPSTASPRGKAEGDPAGALAEIGALIGLERVKEQIRTFVQVVEFNQARVRRGLKGSDMTMHSLFLGNPGTGKTTVARLLGRTLFQAGAIQRDVFVEVGRRDLVSEHLGGSARLAHKVLESARGGVLFIDEAYSLYQEKNNEFAQEAVDAVLAFMENNRDEIVVIFAGYTDRMQDFLNMNPGLKSRVPNRFDFEDYSTDDIATIGYEDLLADQYTVDESTYRRVVAAKYARSADKSNGRWVRNFNQELVTTMVRRVMGDGSGDLADLTSITDGDLRRVAGGEPERNGETIEDLLAQLDSMVGLAAVKDWVRKLVNRVAVDRHRMELDGAVSRPNYHMAFTGNPGTGKTTVAGIIARLFHRLGILEQPSVKVVDRSRLVGRFVGETERNTSRAIDEAMGGVIFVDEAYQLHTESFDRDFGRQAIETFMTRLENDRDAFVAIFAGYTDEMDRFLDANPGLRSRVPWVLEFPDFTAEEVARIVVARLAKDWTFDPEILAGVATAAYDRADPRDRTNGRWARNFAERIESEQIEHIAATGLVGPAMKRIPDEVILAFGE